MPSPEEKRWTKEARSRRQALKKASVSNSTNLFQARIRRTEFNNRPSGNSWVWVLFALVVVAGGVGLWFQRTSIPLLREKTPEATLTPATTPVVAASTAPIVPVAVSMAPVAAPAVNAAVTVDTETPHAVVPDDREWHGATSDVHDARQVVVKGRNAWRALHAEMGSTHVPRVNFNDHLVVGVFLGAKPSAGFEVQLGAPQESANELAIPYRVISPLPGAPMGTDVTYPWQLRVIPRTAKPIRFTQDTTAPVGPSH